jgi:glycosyltransferase involved in cell wall biosynthesis
VSARALVSVVIPLFDGRRFLAAALDSVLAQLYRPIEIIVVDDGSRDGGAEVARSYPGVQVVSQPNAGNAAARNAGIARARGELVAFLDQDDLWAPHKLERQVGRMTVERALGYTVAHHRFFFEPGVARPAWLRPELVDRNVPAFVPGALLARAELFERVGVFDPRLRSGSDTDWFVRCREARVPMALLEELLLFRRIHGRNLSADAGAGSGDLVQTIHAALARRRAPSSSRP